MTPMPKRSMWLRTPLFLLTLLQLSVPAAASWADARAGEQSTGPAHIESHSTDACARIHPADCAFHRFLSAPLAGHAAAVLRFADRRSTAWTSHAPPDVRSVTHLSLPDSRAPPPLS